jgi:Ser/Thr protein kinase RdoA (MazF antagonist)
VGATTSTASALGLTVDDVVVLRDSDKLMLRLLPCDVVARIAHVGRNLAEFEVELAQRLAETGSPVAALDPRVEPRVYRRDGFALSLWTYYAPVPPREVAPAEYADALYRLHAGMRGVEMPTPRFTDRVAGALSLLASRDRTPELPDADRELLSNTLRTVSRTIEDRAAPEQLLHGEPHPGNLLRTKEGLVFIDLETCCRGPVEFDIAHAVDLDGRPSDLELVLEAVSERYPNADRELVRLCRVLALAMVTTWRWNRDDELPDGRRFAREWLIQLRRLLERHGSSGVGVES